MNAKYSDLNDALCQIKPLIAPNVVVDCVDLVQSLDDEMNLTFGRELAFQSAFSLFWLLHYKRCGPKHVNWQNIIAIEYEVNEQVVQNAYADYGRDSDVEKW